MVVLDSFPFQEDSDVQYLGGVRRSAHVSAGHRRRKEICFNSPEASVVESVNFSSNTTVYRSRGKEQAGNSQEYMKRVGHSQGYMEGVENSEGYMKCRLCHYQTKIESLLRRHVIKHSLDSDFRCPACDFRENDASKFVDHIGTHQSGKLVRCCFCPKKMSRGKLKSHIRIHRAVELYDCSMCQFSTNYEKTIKSHMDVYHTKEYCCQQCGLIMTKHDLHWHMKFVHSMEPTETGASQEQGVPLPVPAGRGTNSKTPRFPTKIIPNQSIFSRKFGASKIPRKTSMALKLQKHAVAKKQFNCGKCDYKTPFKKLLRTHRAKHLLDNSLVCSKCGFKETGPGKFASHLALHSPKDLFECCFCGFQTPTRGTMSNHVSKHKPVPMFDCSECEFAAKRPASVRKHTANVHGKRSRCSSCGVEMSRVAMSQHRKECHNGDILNPGTGPPSQSVESEQQELGIERGASYSTGDFNQQDENTVLCEFCKKPYAKSYVRKHVKKCQVESGPGPESGRRSELEPILPDLQPVGRSLDNEEAAVALLNPPGISDDLEHSKSYDSALSQSKSPSKSYKPKKPHLRCNSCLYKTRKKRLLKKHVVKHLIDFRLTCPECGHKEMSSFKFAHHILQHGSDPETFHCCFCSLSAPTSKRSYCAHLDLHRPVNIFDCSKCEYSSNRADGVRNHCKNNHSKNRKCWLCGEVMSKVRLIKHLLAYHGEVRDANLKLGKADEAIPNEATSSYSQLQRIKSTGLNLDGQSTTQWQHPVDEMEEPAETSRTVNAEHSLTDFETPLFETDQDFLKCTKCTFKTKIQSLMDRHIAKHLIDVPFVCPLCGFEHMSSRKFANHWDKHDCNAKKKIYQCCFCDAEVKKKNCLKAFLPQHIEEHRPVALQDCPECEFSSHSRYELDKHYKNQHVKKCECLLCGEVMTIFEHSFHTECKGTDRTEPNNDCPETANRADHQSLDFSTLRRRSAEVQESLIAALEDPAYLFGAEPSASAEPSKSHPESRPRLVTKHYLHCSSCDYKTEFKSLLKRHVLKHLIDVPFFCKKCRFSSFDERTFADHIFVHTGSYKCHFCSFHAGNAGAAARHFSSHKVLALHDCPKCEYTSTYQYRLVEHLRGKHMNTPRCSYCGKKVLKDELYYHERICGRSLRRKLEYLSAREMPEDQLTQDSKEKSPRVFAETSEHVEVPSGQLSGLSDVHFSSVERIRCADDAAMKGLLLHQLNLVATQEHSGSDVESSQPTDGIGMLGSVHHPAKIRPGLPSTVGQVGCAGESSQRVDQKVLEVTSQSNALPCLSGQENPDMSAFANCVPAVTCESNSAASLADTSAHDDMPAVVQELASEAVLPSQDTWLKHPVCLSSTNEISALAGRVPGVIQESNLTAVTVGQDPCLINSV